MSEISGVEFRDGLLKVRKSPEGDRIRLALEGELDLANVKIAEIMLDDACFSGKQVVIDLRKLEFLDSTGIALLLAAMQRAEGRRLSFLPSESLAVRRVLRITGLDEALPLADDQSDSTVLPAA